MTSDNICSFFGHITFKGWFKRTPRMALQATAQNDLRAALGLPRWATDRPRPVLARLLPSKVPYHFSASFSFTLTLPAELHQKRVSACAEQSSLTLYCQLYARSLAVLCCVVGHNG